MIEFTAEERPEFVARVAAWEAHIDHQQERRPAIIAGYCAGVAIGLTARAHHGNAIRPIPLTRKNALLAGSDDGTKTWARIASLIGTCKLNGVNPEAYIAATLRKILNQHMQRDIDELMPWNFVE